ncbi:DUF7373 family lipoprotein [Nocardia mexicana]|uniref:Uncharacterized protein n=1 Tax=Nocardia mexicana TaxID=279262 RepID=A0A370H517_9NOCA|nr:hypothetical protein [Nocardia mexicana]RDI50868.1 hypothetical protein DFR68_105345 [Nocardia mexicana]
MYQCDKGIRKTAERCGTTVVVACAAMLLAGCVVSGSPVPFTSQLATLEVGRYPAEPPPEPHGSDEKYGRVVESVRMGEAVIDPVEADPDLAFGPPAGAQPLPAPAKTLGLLAAPTRTVLEQRGMLAGFSVTASDRNLSTGPIVGASRLLTVVLLRFPDAEAARQAAQEIDSADAAVNTDNVPLAVPGFAQARAHWRPAVPTLAATMAHESMVISLLVGHTAPDASALGALAGRAFTAQLARLKSFVPTPRDRFATLPLDRDGMLRRLVPERPGGWPYPVVAELGTGPHAGWASTVWASGVVFGPHAVRLRGARPRTVPTVELGAVSGHSSLARYPTAAVARRAVESEDGIGPLRRAAAAPKGLPEAVCAERIDLQESFAKYECRIHYGRYLARVAGRDLVRTQQKTAAQYALLVASGPG